MKRRSGQTFALLLVATLVLLPASASAEPPDRPPQGNDQTESTAPAPGESGDASGRSGEPAPGNSGGSESGPAGSAASPGEAGRPGRGQADPPGKAEPAGVAGGLGGGRPAVTPSGVVPTAGGLGSVDARLLPTHLGAAIVMFNDAATEPPSSAMAVEASPGGLSGGLLRILPPVVPPLLADALTSPVVVVEALVEAMASSGHALVLPFVVAAAWLLSPARRGRDLVAEALEA